MATAHTLKDKLQIVLQVISLKLSVLYVIIGTKDSKL